MDLDFAGVYPGLMEIPIQESEGFVLGLGGEHRPFMLSLAIAHGQRCHDI